MKTCNECNNDMFVGFMHGKMYWLCIWCMIGVEK